MAILFPGRNKTVKEQSEPCYLPSLLSVPQLHLAPHLLSDPSLLEAPEGPESQGVPEGPAPLVGLEHPAEHR